MTRPEFLELADRLQEFLVDSMDEFITGAGLEFDRETFVRETGVDLAQLSVEALFYGADAYSNVEVFGRRVA